jgi:hypothetical protein
MIFFNFQVLNIFSYGRDLNLVDITMLHRTKTWFSFISIATAATKILKMKKLLYLPQ